MPRRLRSYPNTELKEALMCDIISNSENHYKSSSSSIKLQEAPQVAQVNPRHDTLLVM